MTPEQLFLAHKDKAEKLAERLSWHFAAAGAQSFSDEAKGVARLTLWNKCREFDPKRQTMAKIRWRWKAESTFWGPLMGTKPSGEVQSARDPYDSFWLWAQQRVRGSVMDYFRSQKLIVRGATSDNFSIPYPDKYVSLEHADLEFKYSHESPEREDTSLLRDKINGIISKSNLTNVEETVLRKYYSEDGFDLGEIAESLGRSRMFAAQALKSAISKMRDAAIPHTGTIPAAAQPVA